MKSTFSLYTVTSPNITFTSFTPVADHVFSTFVAVKSTVSEKIVSVPTIICNFSVVFLVVSSVVVFSVVSAFIYLSAKAFTFTFTVTFASFGNLFTVNTIVSFSFTVFPALILCSKTTPSDLFEFSSYSTST